jgi:diguanylate cyclase (GGDEF)-like protein
MAMSDSESPQHRPAGEDASVRPAPSQATPNGRPPARQAPPVRSTAGGAQQPPAQRPARPASPAPAGGARSGAPAPGARAQGRPDANAALSSDAPRPAAAPPAATPPAATPRAATPRAADRVNSNGTPAPAPSAAAKGSSAQSPDAEPVAEDAPPSRATALTLPANPSRHGAPGGSSARGGRRAVWAVAAVVCLAAGTVGSILGAQSVASRHAADQRAAFGHSATAIAATLKLAIQREEELAVSASTYFAENPKASGAEFGAWVKWAQTLRRYPELEGLGFVTLVRSSELPAFVVARSGHPVKTPAIAAANASTTANATTSAAASAVAASSLHIIPAGRRPYYCLASAGLARGASRRPAAGLDYCATTPSLLASRETALRTFTAATAAQGAAVGLQTPVYRGSVTPRSTVGRRAAFVGWLHEVLVPAVVMQTALQGHPENAARLRYGTSAASAVFASGTPEQGAQSSAANLHNGWTVRTFGPAVSTAISADGEALALLIAGIVLSATLALLIFSAGSAGGHAPTRRPGPRTPHEDLYDELTGLPNHGLTLDLAERMVARAGRQSGMLAGALFIDIDWFSDVNEKLGEAAGDQLLTIVARRLENVVRTGDTVGRIGGDQFVVLVESEARNVRLDSLARRVMESLHKPVNLDDFGPSFFLTASIGVAFGRYGTPAELLRDSKLALDAAKDVGKDRYTLFNASMRSVIEGRGVLEAELNTALVERQFFLLYQPIYDLGTGEVVALEALIRWRHPSRGVLQPSEFLPLAEETGLIVPIGRWVLEEACARTAAWNVAGHRVGISAMVSANQLNREGFATDVRRALQQSGIDPSLLTLEIAEPTVMLDLEAAAARMQPIKQLGVRIAIDDFGSGYAYRSDLQRMPLDFLKVDRSSLAASDDEDYRSWLLEAILHFGRDLSLTVIAKGVETFEQMTALQSMGCTLAQGYFMGDPTPGNAVEGLFSADFAATHSGSPDQLH